MMDPKVRYMDGTLLPFDPQRLRRRLQSYCSDFEITPHINLENVVTKVQMGLPTEISIAQLVNLTAETLASLTTVHYKYSLIGSRVLTSYLQSTLSLKFSDNFSILFENFRSHSGEYILSPKLYKIIKSNSEMIDKAIDSTRDFDIDYFGFRTLEKSYLLKLEDKLHETPQFLFMRVALGIHMSDIDSAIETYNYMSQKYFIHASPTLFNSGYDKPYLSSCFLLAMKDDSIDGIYRTLYDTAMISKGAGGIGIHVSNIRAAGAHINGSNGISSGLIPMLKVFNSTAKYVDQGGNKRPGAFCIYLEPWHADVFDFLNMRKNHGKEEMRARDLFMALWIPDLFMRKVANDEEWCLFSPDNSPGLNECYGDEFVSLYSRYESENRFVRKIKARQLWLAIMTSQTETGNPFLLYKDRCNYLSNQKNLGIIKSSNLCCEIIEYSSKDETAVCNLASVALPKFVENGKFNFQKLHDVCKIVVRNLNRIIDVNYYPLKSCEQSNMKHRPIGMGVQGLADTFFLLRLPFGSPESKDLNTKIFETLYHAALEQSHDLAVTEGKYESFDGSPLSQGLFQFDLWKTQPSDLWEWEKLRKNVITDGVRNSLLVALMPTASTSQILGYNECFEPVTSNIYIRRVLSGEYQVVNKYLVDDLASRGLWDLEMKNKIIEHHGSIQSIAEIPKEIRNLYKTVWEISQKTIIDMAAERGPFIDQSQSMNLFLQDVTYSKLTSMHFYAWRKGLKTGMYYLRTKAAAAAIQFSLGAIPTKRMREDSTTTEEEDDLEELAHDITEPVVRKKYDIHNKRIINCNLQDLENCDSCSG